MKLLIDTDLIEQYRVAVEKFEWVRSQRINAQEAIESVWEAWLSRYDSARHSRDLAAYKILQAFLTQDAGES